MYLHASPPISHLTILFPNTCTDVGNDLRGTRILHHPCMYACASGINYIDTLSGCLVPRGSAGAVNQNIMTVPTYRYTSSALECTLRSTLLNSPRTVIALCEVLRERLHWCYIICGARSESSDGGLTAGNGHCRVTVLQLACAASAMRQHLFCCTIGKGR